jgi:hypothetical protein
MRMVASGMSAAILAMSVASAHASEIAVFHFKFGSFKTFAEDGAPEPLIVDHAANEIKRRGLSTVTLYTSCDTAEADCKNISRVRHNVVAIALIEKVGFGKLKVESRYLGTSAPAIDKGPDVQEPLNRTVRVMAPD